MRNQWDVEGHIKRHPESQRLPMIVGLKEKHIVRSALKNRITMSRNIQPYSGNGHVCIKRSFCSYSASKICSGVDCQLDSHHKAFPCQWSRKRDGDSDAPNDKFGQKNGAMSSFQTSLCSDSRMRAWRLRGERTSTACISYQCMDLALSEMAWVGIWYITRTSLVHINYDLKVGQSISDMLRPVVVPYLRGLPNTLFQLGNARLHVARHVLTFLDPQVIRLLPDPAQPSDLSPIEIIWPCDF